MNDIQYVGAKELDDAEKKTLDDLSAEYYGKIQRKVKNVTSLKIHVKKHTKGGKPNYSVHLNLVAPTRDFECSASSWDFAKTMHMVFNETVMFNNCSRVYDAVFAYPCVCINNCPVHNNSAFFNTGAF